MLVNALLTKEILSVKLGLSDSSCSVCGANVEYVFHLLKECTGSRAIAFRNSRGAMIYG